jgi:phage-related protein
MSEWKTIYYSNKRGEKVVMDEILSFGSKNAAGIFHTIDLLNEYGVGLTGRHVKHIEDKLWELRIDRYRVLYLALTNKTPRKEINLAKRRLGDFLGRSGDGYEKNN